MDVCECMARENASGDSVCVRCHGDVYGCDCPLVHAHGCRFRFKDGHHSPALMLEIAVDEYVAARSAAESAARASFEYRRRH